MIRFNSVTLRALTEQDAGPYEQWINDEETNAWRGLYHPTSAPEARRWIGEQMTAQPDRLTLAVDLNSPDAKKPGTFSGLIGLRAICPRSQRAEIWIYLGAKAVWGKGHGQDAVAALCRYAFEEMNLFRLWLETDPEHKAAVRCYEKVGFVREGTLRRAYYRHGFFRDTCIMGLLRPDFCVREGSEQ